MLDFLTISNMLMESGSLKNRIVLENIPTGKEYLRPIINAMRWYLLAKDKVQKIVIRTYPPFTNYLRTLPIHHSQKEVKTTPDYADFEFYLRPTFDFRQELLSQCNEVEVLEPAEFRKEMKEMIEKMLERYR